MATRFEYSTQARTYDTTRSASPSVMRVLTEALPDPSGGAVLLDIGGGTGNYAVALRERGWRSHVVDRNDAMLAQARHKALPTVRADAAALPVPSGSVDAAVLVSMLHHVPDWRSALAEAERVVRPGGVVALVGCTREHLNTHGIENYFPVTRDHFAAGLQTRSELLAELPGAREIPVVYEDLVDGSLAALARSPERLLVPEVRRQTSFIEWTEREEPEELAAGLARLSRDLDAGLQPQRRGEQMRQQIGDALVFAWSVPS